MQLLNGKVFRKGNFNRDEHFRLLNVHHKTLYVSWLYYDALRTSRQRLASLRWMTRPVSAQSSEKNKNTKNPSFYEYIYVLKRIFSLLSLNFFYIRSRNLYNEVWSTVCVWRYIIFLSLEYLINYRINTFIIS